MKLKQLVADNDRIVGLDDDGQAWVTIFRRTDGVPTGWQRMPMVEVDAEGKEVK